jgi:hypothetical protein
MTPPAWQGAAVVMLAGLVYDILLATVRRADSSDPDGAAAGQPAGSSRWLGYARDASNLVGFLLFFLGFFLLGFPGPLALLAAALATLGFYGLDFLLARTLGLGRPGAVFFVVVTGVAVLVAALRAPIAGALNSAVTRLYS